MCPHGNAIESFDSASLSTALGGGSGGGAVGTSNDVDASICMFVFVFVVVVLRIRPINVAFMVFSELELGLEPMVVILPRREDTGQETNPLWKMVLVSSDENCEGRVVSNSVLCCSSPSASALYALLLSTWMANESNVLWISKIPFRWIRSGQEGPWYPI